MNNMKTVLVTGGAGYIGSVVVRLLLNAGHRVVVADVLRSGGAPLLEIAANPRFTFHKVDIRDQEKMTGIIDGCDTVVHLAAIVGDPACKAEPELARSTNLDGAKVLYDLAEKSGCRQFVFASTCSNYGKMSDPDTFITEDSALSPISLYAETKVAFEEYLLSRSKGNTCIPTCLRFSTVYGYSPRVRFDLTVNDFTKELCLGRELVIFGEQFWRPYCHVVDLARSVCTMVDADPSVIGFDVFNVGNTSENYTKKMLADLIQSKIPGAQIKYVHRDEDPRDYRVNFDKIKNKVGFTITKTVPDGVDEIIHVLNSGLIEDPDAKMYYNV